MSTFQTDEKEKVIPRVAVFSFASCFGCQLQITNQEQHLLDVVGQIDLVFWGMTSSAPLPESYDVAVIEGAVTNQEAYDTVKKIRETAKVVIAIGACACTGGVPGMGSVNHEAQVKAVYGDVLPETLNTMMSPRGVTHVIDCDFTVPCCPIDFYEFCDVLHCALIGSNRFDWDRTMCGDCKKNETTCFYEKGQLCMGLITKAGCGARCVKLGRPCNGCRGLSASCNLEAARYAVGYYGLDPKEFDKALEMFNAVNPAFQQYAENVKEG